VLIGENGAGKTTLLRALALALATPEVASKQLHSRLPMVRNGGPARLAFTFNTGTYRAEVHRADGRSTEAVSCPSETTPPRPWVVAYGVRRGNALGEEGRIPDWGPEGDLHTLFDRQPALVVAQDWLLKLDRRVAREKAQADAVGSRASTPAQDLWNAVVGALERILDVEKITAGDDDSVYVKPRDQERVRLESLSDGYLTTAGWIVDLVARWVRMREAEGDVLMGDILGQMLGIVLVDEIDLHLHPRWQMRVLDDVRRFFPRLSFIVTTHNPLTLQSAKAGEVFVVRRGDAGPIELVQRDIHAGYDVDRTLLELFNIDHTFDPDTRTLLREYRRPEASPPISPGFQALYEGGWQPRSTPRRPPLILARTSLTPPRSTSSSRT
jgi:energy-coupling factor transporter ATP-binding protein EcfA2